LAVNGEAVYNTTPTLFGPEAGAFSPIQKDENGNPKFIPSWNWRSTTKADKIYIEIFTWPDSGTFHLVNSPRKVTSAHLLADSTHKPLTLIQTGNGVDVQLPAKALDPIATVLVLNTSN
jgi:alpha-L-fucosidase